MNTLLNLQHLGISKEEYLVYLEILKSPPINISDFAGLVKMNRTTLYSVLTKLEQKKLISKSQNSKSKVKYIAASPQRLLEFAEGQHTQFEEELGKLKQTVPFLSSIAAQAESDIFQDFLIFRGDNALDEIDKIVLKSKETLLGFAYEYHIDACFAFDKKGNLAENDYLRAVMKVGDKFVFPGDEETIHKCRQFLTKNPHLEGKWQPRWIEKEKLQFNLNLYCFEDTVIFSVGSYAGKDFLGYLIKNQQIADSMKSLSLFLWHHAHPLS